MFALFFYFPLLQSATKLGQGNIFRSVCQEFCPRGRGGLPHCMLGYTTIPLGPEAGTPPGPDTPTSAVRAGRYGQQAGGTHPTGMQSCYEFEELLGNNKALKRHHVPVNIWNRVFVCNFEIHCL